MHIHTFLNELFVFDHFDGALGLILDQVHDSLLHILRVALSCAHVGQLTSVVDSICSGTRVLEVFIDLKLFVLQRH